MLCRLEGLGRGGQQSAIEGGDEDSVSKLADREAVASETERRGTTAVSRKKDRARQSDARRDENSTDAKVFRGTRAKKTVTSLEKPPGALDEVGCRASGRIYADAETKWRCRCS